MQLYFLDYNNYHNRVIKREASLNDYLTYEVARETNANFMPNDGVTTRFVVNSNTVGNYMIAVNDGVIVSRWFIEESVYTRNKQHMLTLRRDVIADYYDNVLSAPCFIEKATLSDNDPLIYNSEEMSFNQIKTSETLIKDKSKSSWIVGYYSRNHTEEGQEVVTEYSGNVKVAPVPSIFVDGPISNWEYYEYASGKDYNINLETWELDLYASKGLQNEYSKFTYHSPFVYSYTVYSSAQPVTNPIVTNNLSAKDDLQNGLNGQSSRFEGKTREQVISEDISVDLDLHTNYSEVINLNGKIIESNDDGLKKYYKISVSQVLHTNFIDVNRNTNPLITTRNELVDIVNDSQYFTGTKTLAENNQIKITCQARVLSIVLTEVSEIQASYNISSTRYNLQDAPYDMFAIPYSDELVIKDGGTVVCNASKQVGFETAMAIAEKYYGSGTLYDLQLLPYCPIQGFISDDEEIDVAGDSKLYSTIVDEDDNVVGIIFNCYQSTFTLDIPLENPIVITEKKIQNLTDMYRLCSPNYNGTFEFSPAKNNGVTSFNVDCAYKPFNPYIHMNPDFGGLYGQDFDDARGLVLAGDYSLPVVTDAWENYQIQNKNYQNIFDRQIQNMEVNNKLNNIRAGVGAGASAIATGLTAGATTGLIGGLIAGVGSAIAGGVDYAMQKQQQAEAIDYTKDQFGYGLQNIQALPESISKTSAFTPNNKIFPVLEYYTCTDEEKQALRDKIKYNGMTVMRIGKIEDYLQVEPSYIKGQIIRLELDEDDHMIEQITNEIYKGVFI